MQPLRLVPAPTPLPVKPQPTTHDRIAEAFKAQIIEEYRRRKGR